MLIRATTKNIISLVQLISKFVENNFSSMRLVISPWRLDLVKRWRINPLISSNIPASPGYGVYISQLVRYSRACAQYSDFLDIVQLMTRKLLEQGFVVCRLNSTIVITIWLTVTKYPYLKWQWIFYFLRRCFLSSTTAKTFTGLDYNMSNTVGVL